MDKAVEKARKKMFKTGDEVVATVKLSHGPKWFIPIGRKGVVEAVFAAPGRMPHVFVRFSANYSGTWAQNCFRKAD